MSGDLLIGIDPGVGGGIAVLDPETGFRHSTIPKDDETLLGTLLDMKNRPWPRSYAYLEQVTGYIAGAPRTGSSMFTFGGSFARLKLALTASNIPYVLVPPRTWQSALNLGSPKDHPSHSKWKSYLSGVAKNLWGDPSITLKTADAALILWYASKKVSRS
jgi:hypothetical protein